MGMNVLVESLESGEHVVQAVERVHVLLLHRRGEIPDSGAAKTMRMRPSSMETTEKHHPNHFRKWMSVHDYIKPGLKCGPSGWPRRFLGWKRAYARENPGVIKCLERFDGGC